MNFYDELMKIFSQLRGSKNIFGYKTLLANQLYLFYCFSGKIYFTDKIPFPLVKYLWSGVVLCQIVFSFVIGWTYLRYGSAQDYDIDGIFNVANATGALLTTGVGLPLIFYFNIDGIETMIDRVDDILTIGTPSELQQRNIEAKKNFSVFFYVHFSLMSILLSSCFLDVAFLFEESKLNNYLYYALPIFINQEYVGIWWYIIVNGISTIFYEVMVFEVWMAYGVISYWCTVWCNELASLRDEINAAMDDSDNCEGLGECSDDWNEAFECALKRSVAKFRKITFLINDFRRFFEVFGTISISPVFFYCVFYLHNCFSKDATVLLVMKNLTACLATIVPVFFFYWIGQNLENSMFEVSSAVYSSSWHRSVKVRKNVYIFLCQIQSVNTFTIFKVYSLLLNNFSRYVHSVVSYTNILQKLTKK